jgi:hypothetical protein
MRGTVVVVPRQNEFTLRHAVRYHDRRQFQRLLAAFLLLFCFDPIARAAEAANQLVGFGFNDILVPFISVNNIS